MGGQRRRRRRIAAKTVSEVVSCFEGPKDVCKIPFDDIFNVVGVNWNMMRCASLIMRLRNHQTMSVVTLNYLLMTAAKADFLFFRNCTLSSCFLSFCMLE